MKLTYFNIDKSSHLVENFYHISYSKEKLPFNTKKIPLGYTGFTFVYNDGQDAFIDGLKKNIKGLVLNGQFNKSYKFNVVEAGYSCGINFKPTALYKLTGLDISNFTNAHTPINKINKNLAHKFELFFLNHNNNFIELFQNLDRLLFYSPLIENKNTIAIDKAINYIIEKDGMVSVKDLLDKIPFSQKTLETHFKKIVGLTPSKFIKIHRFTNLMKQYEKSIIDFTDLIHMYDYYDKSNFQKDFKLFTGNTLKEYFKEDFQLLKKF